MICFRDRSWCVQSLNGVCKNTTCLRFFTKEDREHAIEWWGDEEFPLAIADFKTDSCGWNKEC